MLGDVVIKPKWDGQLLVGLGLCPCRMERITKSTRTTVVFWFDIQAEIELHSNINNMSNKYFIY